VASSPWATTWTVYLAETNDLNNFYVACPDGSMYAYSLKDGHLLWTSSPIPSTEYPNNAVPFVEGGMLLVGGNLYEYAGYSLGYQINPVPRFGMLVCINATTGSITYTLNGGALPNAVSNGYLTASGVYDGNLYCIGKGPTSTTVSAPQTAITAGTPVIISGSVLDTSPDSSSPTLTAMYPNGVPAISDANMSVWMDYLHMQNSTLLNAPPNCIGIPVTLTAMDPNGNSVNIGTAISDGGGHFAYRWTPTTEGLYTVYATFAGTNSYFSSYGETSANVESAPSSSPASTSTQLTLSSSDMITYFAISTIAIIIAIAIVGVLLLRRKA
jgi:hypothetical protein